MQRVKPIHGKLFAFLPMFLSTFDIISDEIELPSDKSSTGTSMSGPDYKDYILNKICSYKWHASNVLSLIGEFRDIVMTNDQRLILRGISEYFNSLDEEVTDDQESNSKVIASAPIAEIFHKIIRKTSFGWDQVTQSLVHLGIFILDSAVPSSPFGKSVGNGPPTTSNEMADSYPSHFKGTECWVLPESASANYDTAYDKGQLQKCKDFIQLLIERLLKADMTEFSIDPASDFKMAKHTLDSSQKILTLFKKYMILFEVLREKSVNVRDDKCSSVIPNDDSRKDKGKSSLSIALESFMLLSQAVSTSWPDKLKDFLELSYQSEELNERRPDNLDGWLNLYIQEFEGKDTDSESQGHIEQLIEWFNTLCKERVIEDTGLAKIIVNLLLKLERDMADFDTVVEMAHDMFVVLGPITGRPESNETQSHKYMIVNARTSATVCGILIEFLNAIYDEMEWYLTKLRALCGANQFIDVIKLAGGDLTNNLYNFLTAFGQVKNSAYRLTSKKGKTKSKPLAQK
ncbi:3846_t:CDS:10, partial [Racocetra fulgida]